MVMGTLTIIAALLLLVTPDVYAESCPAMARKLIQMRMEYHDYAANRSPSAGTIDFNELVERLDAIVELKNSMRKANCPKIPARPKDLDVKR